MAISVGDDIRWMYAQYVMRRLGYERFFSARLRTLLLKAVDDIIQASFRRGFRGASFSFEDDEVLMRRVNQIVDTLKRQINDEIEGIASLSAVEKDDSDEFVTDFLKEPLYGRKRADLLDKYGNRLISETERYIAAGIMLDMGEKEIQESYAQEYEHPYTDSIINEAYGKKDAGSFVHYGRGSINSSFKELDRLGRSVIAITWMAEQNDYERRDGKSGFLVFRGSSYPCSLCDEQTGWVHDFDDELPPFHNRCVCYAVYI